MSWWPGWDSADGAGWWSHFHFWLGIAALAVMTLAEVASHVYGLRKDELVAVAESRLSAERAREDERHAAEAEKMRQQVADAERKAAEAAQQAARLQEHAAQRALSRQQKEALVAALSPFKGQPVTIASVMGDGDGDVFKSDFALVLRAAAWSFDEKSLEGQSVISPTPIGVQITMNETEARAGRILKAAEVFAATLQQLGITQNAGGKPTVFVNQQVPVGTVALVVGNKPSL